MTRMLHFVIVVACLVMPLSVYGEVWQRMDEGRGLSSMEMRQMVCLPSGRVLAVGEGTVDVFDGARWHTLPLERRRSVELHSFLSRDNYLDSYGRLWVRSLHELFALDVRTLRQVDVREWLAAAGVAGALQNFFVDADGTAWLHVGEDSLLRVAHGGRAELVMCLSERNPDNLRASVCDIVQAGKCHYIFFSSGNMICIESATGRQLYRTSVGSPVRGYYLRAKAEPASNNIIVRLRDDDGASLLVRYNTGRRAVADTLLRRHVADFTFSRDGRLFTTVCDDAPADLQALAIDEENGIWYCTADGGVLYRSPLNQQVSYRQLGEAYGVQTLAQLPNGAVVAGTTRGLYRTTGSQQWEIVGGTEEWNVARLDLGGSGLYVSTHNRGLWAVDTMLAVRWHFGAEHNQHMRDNVAFCFDLPDGRQMFNCRLNRLMAFDQQARQMECISEQLGNLVQTYRYIIDYAHVHDGWLMATQNGLSCLEYLASKGTFRLNPQRYAALSDNPWSIKCNCLLADADGRIFVGTQNGLVINGDTLRRLSTANGLPSNCIRSMAFDADGGLWLATTQGLCRVDTASGGVLVMGSADGVRDCDFSERAALRLANGRMMFGTRHGLYMFHPDSLLLPDVTLKPRLLGVSVAGMEADIVGRDTIVLRHNQNFLTFHVSALNYSSAQHTRYRYRLNGIDRDWVTIQNSGGNIDISYTALPHGHYTLEVQAALQGQPWGESMRAEVTILPPLWLTWWAKLLYVLLLLALAALVWFLWAARSRNRDLQRRIDQLLQEAEERRAEAKEEEPQPHDEEEHEDEAPQLTEPEEPVMSDDARRFLEKALKCIDRNMSNSEYSIEDFASDMAMERSTLYRKLLAVMGQKPLEFVRIIRLNRAAELLRTGRYSVVQVSEMVGFNSPRYFSKHFRDRFGCLPSEYR